MARILVVDNYDSFVYNLVQYLGADRGRGRGVAQRRPALRRPGLGGRLRRHPALARPGHARGGRRLHRRRPHPGRPLPIFGVCLGLQSIAVAFGGVVEPGAGAAARQDLAWCTTTDAACSPACPNPFTATRYHSLALDPATVPDDLEVTATHRVRRDHGRPAPRAADRVRPVPPRVGAHRGRLPDARQLAGRLRGRRTPRAGRPG